MRGQRAAASWMLVLVMLTGTGLPPFGASTHAGRNGIPAPAEFADLTDRSGVDFAAHKWTPALGEPSSLLDVLPVGSPAAADFNRDGWVDVFFPSPQYTNDTLNAERHPASSLYLNDGSRTTFPAFKDVSDVAGLEVQGFAYAASWGDHDRDGWPDLFVGGYRMARLFRNNADGTFAEVTVQAALPQDGLVVGGAWGDYDRDGWLDLLLVQLGDYTHPDDGLPDLRELPGKANVLLRNLGDGTFEDASASSGIAQLARRSTSTAFVDADGDGWPDLYVTNYGQPAEYWRNLGDGTFAEEAARAGIADGLDATCQAWGDLDGDGLLDLFAAHEEGAGDGAWLARGDGRFEDISGTRGLGATARGRGWACAAFDFDNDGDTDLFTAHSELRGDMRQQAVLLRNTLNEHTGLGFVDDIASGEACDFDPILFRDYSDTLCTPRAASGAAFFDWNLDGYVDLLTSTGDGDTAHVYLNAGYLGWAAPIMYLKAQLEGSASNTQGLGAVVRVQAGNISAVRHPGAEMAWGAQSAPELTFGISSGEEGGFNDRTTSVSVGIWWPGGAVQSYPRAFGIQSHVRFYEAGGWKNDTYAPRPSLALESGQRGLHDWYTSESVTLRLRAAEVKPLPSSVPMTGVRSLQYSLDGLMWTHVADPGTGVALTFAGDGVHKLWAETTDHASIDLGNGVRVGDPNRAVFLYPIRIDSAPPTSSLLAPAVGTVWAQGREVARVEQLNSTNRAVVLASLPTDFGAVPEAGAALEGALGGDGLQPVEALPRDDTSGVWKVRYEVLRTDGRVEASSPELRWAPFAWTWRVNATPPLEYRILTHVMDYAGHCRGKVTPNGPECPGGPAFMSKVELVPTSPDGLRRLNDISTPAPP